MPKKETSIGKSAPGPSIFIDSSAWISLFSRRDQHHPEADRIFRSIISKRLMMVTTNLVLAEIHRLFLHRAGMEAASVALDKIEASSLVDIRFAGIEHHKSAIAWLKKLKGIPVSYTDAVSFSVMEDAGCKDALSYDRHFQAAGFNTLQE